MVRYCKGLGGNVLQLALPLLLKSLSEEERKENEGLKCMLPNIHTRGAVIIGEKKVLDVLWWNVRY